MMNRMNRYELGKGRQQLGKRVRDCSDKLIVKHYLSR